MGKVRVVVTYVEAGYGHIAGARAVSDVLRKYYGDQIEVMDIDFFKHTNDQAMINMEKSLISQVKLMSSKTVNWGNKLFRLLNLSEDPQKLLRSFYKNTSPTVRKKSMDLIASLNADVIVNTHYLPALYTEELRAQNPSLKLKTVIYNPDNNVHGWWDNRADLLICNNAYAVQEAIEERGFTPRQVKTVGFLARNKILETNGTKQAYRTKYNLDQNKLTVAVAYGAYCSSTTKSIVAELLKSSLPLTVIALAGKDDKALKGYQRILSRGRIPPNIDFRPIGFTDDICEYYKACDVFITKAGPNAILDSLFMHTPVIVYYWASPIEVFSKDLFVYKYGCGEVITNKTLCKKRIEQFILNPQMLAEYRQNTLAFDKQQNGGKQIADSIYELTRKSKPLNRIEEQRMRATQ